MKWQVKIDGKPKQRILVEFDPQGELIIFRGQYSVRNMWIDFSNETHPMDITLDDIQLLLGRVYDAMEKRLRVWEDLDKSFSLIKEIAIPTDESPITIVDNSIYGSPIEEKV